MSLKRALWQLEENRGLECVYEEAASRIKRYRRALEVGHDSSCLSPAERCSQPLLPPLVEYNNLSDLPRTAEEDSLFVQYTNDLHTPISALAENALANTSCLNHLSHSSCTLYTEMNALLRALHFERLSRCSVQGSDTTSSTR